MDVGDKAEGGDQGDVEEGGQGAAESGEGERGEGEQGPVVTEYDRGEAIEMRADAGDEGKKSECRSA